MAAATEQAAGSARPAAAGAATGFDAATAGLAVLLVLVWGTSSVSTKVGMGGYAPGHLALLRFLVTSAVMVGVMAATRMRLPARRDLPGIVGLAFVGISITQLTFVFGLQHVDPGTATFLFATVPVMTAVLARLFLGERLAPVGWAGIALTVVGTTLLVVGRGDRVGFTGGALVILLGAFAEAVYYILQKPFLRRYSGTEVGTWTLIAATIPLLFFLPGLPAEIAAAPPVATAAVVYVALGAGAIGYVCLSKINARVPASVAAVLLAGLPPVALVTAWLWLGEVPRPLSVFGGALAIVGVLVVTLRGRVPDAAVPTTAPAAE